MPENEFSMGNKWIAMYTIGEYRRKQRNGRKKRPDKSEKLDARLDWFRGPMDRGSNQRNVLEGRIASGAYFNAIPASVRQRFAFSFARCPRTGAASELFELVQE